MNNSKMYIESKELLGVLNNVKRTVGNGSFSLYDQCIHMKITDYNPSSGEGVLSVTTTNDVESTTFKHTVECDGNMDFPIVDFKMLYNLIKTFTHSTVIDLSYNQFKLMVNGPNMKKPLTIIGNDPALYHNVSVIGDISSFYIGVNELKSIFDILKDYVSNEKNDVSNCINLRFEGVNLIGEAIYKTDSVMSYVKVPYQEKLPYQGAFFLNVKTLSNIIYTTANTDSNILFEVANDAITLKRGNLHLTAKRIAGVFLRCKDLFPMQYNSEMEVNATELHCELQRAEILYGTYKSNVSIGFSDTGLDLDITTDLGSINTLIPGYHQSNIQGFTAIFMLHTLGKISNTLCNYDISLKTPAENMLVITPKNSPYEVGFSIPCRYEVDSSQLSSTGEPHATEHVSV